MPWRVACLFGTRPEAIKMAPVVRALHKSRDMRPLVIVTAQHRQLLDSTLAVFGIVPDHDLDLMTPDQSLERLTARALVGCTEILRAEKPDMVLVHGDTSTTMAGALAAYYAGIPVGHVEAGLRTGDPREPFPEEINRRVADVLTDLYFAPTPRARANLLREGVAAERIFVTGNTAVDAVLEVAAQRAATPEPARVRRIAVEVHRRESFGAPLRDVVLALRDLARAFPDVELVWSVHPNPNVGPVVRELLEGEPRVRLIAPPEYPDWVGVMAGAHLIVTDSGGLQEEAPALHRPVVCTRNKTERPEAVEAGTVVLAGTDRKTVFDTVAHLLEDPEAYRRCAEAENPFGDGRAARRIVAAVRDFLAAGTRPSMSQQAARN
jgi:UDP-N-acetylglucosamine 2-epimerase (non-hydrolysing)